MSIKNTFLFVILHKIQPYIPVYLKIYNIIIIESRGWEIFTSDKEEDYPENGTFCDYFIVQADKSTCQSNNRTVGTGVPTIDAQLLLDDIAAEYGVFIGMIIQPTHRFDFNRLDALYHIVVKRRLRQYPFPFAKNTFFVITRRL